jgi:hypothetical protein
LSFYEIKAAPLYSPRSPSMTLDYDRIHVEKCARRFSDRQPKTLGSSANRKPMVTPSLVVYNPRTVLTPTRLASPVQRKYHRARVSDMSPKGGARASQERLSQLGHISRMRANQRASKLRQIWS